MTELEELLGALPELPELPELKLEPPRCPICDFYEENYCRPFMKEGDPRECARAIQATSVRIRNLPKDERIKAFAETLQQFGVDPNQTPVTSAKES